MTTKLTESLKEWSFGKRTSEELPIKAGLLLVAAAVLWLEAFIVPTLSVRIGIGVLLAILGLVWLIIAFSRRRVDLVVVSWVAFYPYCYNLFSFPSKQAVFTVDRALILILVVQMMVSRRNAAAAFTPRELGIAGYLYAVFILECIVTMLAHHSVELLYTIRQMVDGMIFPVVVAAYAMWYFPFERNIRKLHIAGCVLGIGIFAVAGAEIITGKDLLPWTGATDYIVGDIVQVRRVDGPFEGSAVLALVSVLALFLISYLRRVMGQKMPPWQRYLHIAGLIACVGASFLPMDRGVVLAMVPIVVVELFFRDPLMPKKMWVSAAVALVAGLIGLQMIDPVILEDRTTGSSNIDQRVAEFGETMHVVHDHPLFGVGFGTYRDIVEENPQYLNRWHGAESMALPHSVPMRVISEEGILGLFVYAGFFGCGVYSIWKMRKANPLAAKAALYSMLVLIITGLDFDLISPSDLNMFYAFGIGVLLQTQIASTAAINMKEEVSHA